MSPNAKPEPETGPSSSAVDRLHELREGAEIHGDCGNSTDQPPPWLDRDRFYRARDVFKKYFFSIFFSHLAGLIMIVHVPTMTTPLMTTGNSSSVVCLFRRYLGTLQHIQRWYEGDIWNPEDPAHHSIVLVRTMHKKVADKMNGSCRRRCPAVSQYDMAVTQFAFIGLILLYPRHVGMYCTREELECLIHFWRGIGYLLGLDDRYNMCDGNLEETIAICKNIMEVELKPALLSPTKASSNMSQGIIKAINSFIIFLSWEAVTRFWYEQMLIPCNFTMGAYEKTGYWLMRFTFGGLLRFRPCHIIFNWLLRIAIKKALGNRERYESHLTRYHSPAHV